MNKTISEFKTGWMITGIIVIVIVAIIALIFRRYRRDMQAAQERLENLGSQVVETDCGQIEYATFGEGYPVLVIHGIFGGFDQGLVLARGQVGEEFQSISPARFGYLGTPLPEDASPADQADAYACLLDTLGIERAAIMGTSAGGTSAIQFALRHPDRCSALILVSSNAPGESVGLPPKPIAQVLFRSDFIFWMLTTYFPSGMYSIMGVPEGFEMTPQQEADMAEVMDTLLPVSPRADGALFDMYISNPDINTGYPLSKISLPVLVIHAKDDPLANYENARSMTEKITDATLVTIDSGGHPLLEHEDKIRSEITEFLELTTKNRR